MTDWPIVREGKSLAWVGGVIAGAALLAAAIPSDLAAWMRVMLGIAGGTTAGMSWGVSCVARERKRFNDLLGFDAWRPSTQPETQEAGK